MTVKTPILTFLVALVSLGLFAASASAITPAPDLTLHVAPIPSVFSVEDNAECVGGHSSGVYPPCDEFQETVTNSGSMTAGPVRLTDVLPAGLSVASVGLFWAENHLKVKPAYERSRGYPIYPENEREGTTTSLCTTEGTPVKVTCEFPESVGRLAPDQRLQLDVWVTVEAGAVAGEDQASVSEDGVRVASESRDDLVGAPAATFGIASFVPELTGLAGPTDTQAGDHPYELATRIEPNTKMGLTTENSIEPAAVQQIRDVVVDLPLGVLGSAVATPKCTFGQLQSELDPCPWDTLVGHITGEPTGEIGVNSGVYAMVPEKGAVAEYGLPDTLHNTHAIVGGVVPTPGGYVVQAVAHEIPQIPVASLLTRFFGDPAVKEQEAARIAGQPFAPVPQTSMFTNSSDCSGAPLQTKVYIDSWAHPGAFNADGSPDVEGPGWVSKTVETPPVTGCEQLRFNPALTFAPEPQHRGADEPAGYESVLTVPQDETPGTLATPPLKTAVVTLPAGVSISPGAANGLVGCQETGPEGINFASAAAGACPGASKVGTAEVTTPLLEEHFTGSVYVAQPSCGGAGQGECSGALAEEGKLFALYLELGSAKSGVHVKLAGKVEVGGNGSYSREHGLAPGQIRTSFVETPQFPVSELKLHFNGGPRAPLANPQGCGTFTTNASLEPWSHTPGPGEAHGTPNVLAQPSFEVAGCTGRFAPAFEADMANPQAGAYSPFTLTISRQDREQDLSGVTVNMPPGLIGKIAGIAQCPEAQANAGTCSAASQIGTATGAAGSGSEPLYQSGPVYLTGPYRGAPFGLSVVVPANAGPYHLGNIVVRAAISVNPSTAQVTVTSNPLPQSIDGVPLRLKQVNVTVGTGDNFTFNPTSCTPSSISATLSSTQGAQAGVSSPFQAGGCASLAFKPVFSASTAGRATKGSGASLDVKVAYPYGPEGTYANIKSVKVDLPKQLPSRLTTLQKACLAATFEANPANCPPDSDVGTATATTPLLNVPVSGPAYLVSHGNEAFPDLEIVLQGEGITLVLDGNTQIKKGITSSTFKTIPDAPVSSFELKLPTKKFSILGANVPEKNKYSLCGQSLSMPTAITAQNGAVIKQTTKIGITGCPKVKKAKAAKRAKQASKSTRRGK